MLSLTILGFIVLIWLFTLNKRGTQAIRLLLYCLIIYYDSFTPSGKIDFVLKILLMLTVIFMGLRFGIKARCFQIIVPLAVCMYLFSLLNAQWGSNYSIGSSITAFASLMVGLLLFCINYKEEQSNEILECISKLALISIIIGIPMDLLGLVDSLGRSGTALAGASLSTNLSFLGTTGVMASEILKDRTHKDKYRWLEYINFGIVCTTLTRGGMVASFIVILPEILDFIKQVVLRKAKYAIIAIVALIAGFNPARILLGNIIQRSFVNGELNTSGRLTAWSYIISLVDNMWIGNGYGNLKTLTDDSRLAAFTAAHNEYIRAYFETGIIGCILLAGIIGTIFYSVLKYRSNKKIDYILMSCLGFLIYALTDNCITNFRCWVPVMCVFGCMNLKARSIKFKIKGR